MIHTVNTSWVENMKFNADFNGHNIIMDTMEENGGSNAGPRPKELMLASIAGCTGMDVVAILKKMKVDIEKFNIEVKSELTEEHPKHYTKMHLVYAFKGNNLDKEKLARAVELSQEKYCGVSAVYRKAMNLTYEIKIDE